MDEAVIRTVKDIAVKRKIAENNDAGNGLDDIREEVSEMRRQMDAKIEGLERKIDLLISKL